MIMYDYTLKYDEKKEMVIEGNKQYVFHPTTGEKWTLDSAKKFIEDKQSGKIKN